MNKKGVIALEALLASAQVLLLAATVAALLGAFWQSWHKGVIGGRQRQWSAMAFAYLERDLTKAERVVAMKAKLSIFTPEGEYIYLVTEDKSFYRGLGSAYYPLAKVESVSWSYEGNVLKLELFFPDESYSCQFYLEGEQ